MPSSSNRCFTFENVLGSSLNSVKVSRFIFICECATRKISYAHTIRSYHTRAQHIERNTIGRFGGVSLGFGSVLFDAFALYALVLRLRVHTHRCVRICVCGNEDDDDDDDRCTFYYVDFARKAYSKCRMLNTQNTTNSGG